MNATDAFLASVQVKTEFYDRHERRAYSRAVEIARHILDNPSAKANALEFLDRHVRPDPRQRGVYQNWRELLTRDPREIVKLLLEDSAYGAELRHSAPVFAVVGGERRTDLLR
jgi:hypothetical protein